MIMDSFVAIRSKLPMIKKDVLPEANGLELPFRVARGARLLGLVRLMER
jgi:hypothetical protein